MIKQPEAITATIRQAKEIYGQIANMVSSADGLMADAEWISANNVAFKGSSQSYSLPTDWLPSAIYREYRNESQSNKVLLLGVILDDTNTIKNINEPLLIGTLMTVSDESEVFPEVFYWDGFWWFMKVSADNADGSAQKIIEPNAVYFGEKRNLGNIKMFAKPLVDFKNSEILKVEFIDVLIALLSE